MWQRGHISDNTPAMTAITRAAFDRARARADDDVILDAARAWVAAADAPRFLPPLNHWLDQDGWNMPPPEKKERRRRSGKGRRQSNGGPVDLCELAWKIGGVRQ
jgi:hypothetical protein